MTDEPTDATPEEPDPQLVEAFAKQLFRQEHPPHLLWDAALFERAGRSLDGMEIADEAVKDDYRRRAHAALLEAAAGHS
jgi:hypothetical protein